MYSFCIKKQIYIHEEKKKELFMLQQSALGKYHYSELFSLKQTRLLSKASLLANTVPEGEPKGCDGEEKKK